jgi:hypothetical protein
MDMAMDAQAAILAALRKRNVGIVVGEGPSGAMAVETDHH